MPHLPSRHFFQAISSIKGHVVAAIVGSMLLWALSSELALGAQRVALVIGNSAYKSVAKLPNPSRDATAVAEMLKNAGFDVVDARIDLEYLDFTRALRRFEDAATGAEIAVVFYAGHGIEIGGNNYLIPVNARLASDRDAQDEAILLERLILSAQPAKNLRLIILDACRDNPFARTMKRQRYTRALHRGLGRVEPSFTNTLIAYAAKAGSTAEDGVGEHSPFTFALLKSLVVPGLDIRLAFGRIRDDVLKRTRNRQEPFVYGSLGGSNIALVPLPSTPSPAVANAPAQSPLDVKGDYDLVERIGTKKAWEVFLATHQTGLYADLARAQLAKLADKERRANAKALASLKRRPGGSKAAAVATPAPAPAPAASAKPQPQTKLAALDPVPPPVAAPRATDEARAWERIKNSSDAEAFRDFIERYTGSVLALTAQKHLTALEDAVEERKDRARAQREAAQRAEENAATELACRREEKQLSELKSSNDRTGVRADLERLKSDLSCERLRPAVLAALKSSTTVKELQETPEPAANTHELVMAAQEELNRVGCFQGSTDGILGPVTRAAVDRYLSARGRSTDDGVTDELIADLKKQKSRVCPLQCSAGEVVKGERCIAEKQKPQRDAHRDRRHRDQKAKSERRRSKKANRPKPKTRQQATNARPRVGSAVIGIGF